MAAQNGMAKVIQVILAAVPAARDSTVNIQRLDGATPLWMASQMGFDHVVRLLLRAGANPDISRNVNKKKTDLDRSLVDILIFSSLGFFLFP